MSSFSFLAHLLQMIGQTIKTGGCYETFTFTFYYDC